MRVFLTGLTGYLGGRLAELLHERGFDIRALVRDPSRCPEPPSGIKLFKGDLLNPSSYENELKEVDVLIHTAAWVRVWDKDKQRPYRVNVEATEVLFRRAVEAGVQKILYTSSFFALGPSSDGKPLTESARPRPPYYNAYQASKAMARERVERLISEGYPIIILYPGVIYGPGRLTQGNHVAKVIRDFQRGLVPGYIGSGHQAWNFAWIDDVALGHILALEKGKIGEGYILGGENRTMRAFFQTLAALLGRRPPRWSIPAPLVKGMAGLQFAAERLLGREPSISPAVVSIYCQNWTYSSQKAIEELGYTITPFEEGIEKTVQWLRHEGLIR